MACRHSSENALQNVRSTRPTRCERRETDGDGTKMGYTPAPSSARIRFSCLPHQFVSRIFVDGEEADPFKLEDGADSGADDCAVDKRIVDSQCILVCVCNPTAVGLFRVLRLEPVITGRASADGCTQLAMARKDCATPFPSSPRSSSPQRQRATINHTQVASNH